MLRRGALLGRFALNGSRDFRDEAEQWAAALFPYPGAPPAPDATAQTADFVLVRLREHLARATAAKVAAVNAQEFAVAAMERGTERSLQRVLADMAALARSGPAASPAPEEGAQ